MKLNTVIQHGGREKLPHSLNVKTLSFKNGISLVGHMTKQMKHNSLCDIQRIPVHIYLSQSLVDISTSGRHIDIAYTTIIV